MLTTDFSGTYDYEKEEAAYAAQSIIEDIEDGYLQPDDIPQRIEKERIHWKRCIPETFEEWDTYFLSFLKEKVSL